ncbi:TolC family protein [Zunongwangia sp. HGR-M22]|uniref:TolC family protein n=1 Tax=Zunongwangia sp. HGR-M22 TaxID=3015168 RepID=UPI0022DDC0D5|nr:efflux transporter outer membrane subunit [Zunongwangia sp. HGR-M22]WBL27038.1 efflux transporter outer membrane subunit [Zunongwangia sp. HGR-M22]
MMNRINKYKHFSYLGVTAGIILTVSSCVPSLSEKAVSKEVPGNYHNSQDSLASKTFNETDTSSSALMDWKSFFNDPHLSALIDTALENNQELNITLQELEIAKSEVQARKGEYLPSIGLKAGAGIDKVGKYTREGAVEENLEIKEGRNFPDPLPDYTIGLNAQWEVDIWSKLHNAKKSAVMRYLSSVEGRNFMVTNLIAEIANSYYELLALDNQLQIVKNNIEIQERAYRIVKLQKQAARVTQLAVSKFNAEVLHTKSLQFDIQQRIVETENKLNFLVGRYPQPIQRNSDHFAAMIPKQIDAGLPSQLLQNRPDIRQAEYELQASKLDIKVARARFYPSLGISANVGYQAFNPDYLLNTPESLIYSVAGDLMAPLVNRNAIKAAYKTANAKQVQAAFDYEQTVLKAYIEVANQLSKIDNLKKSYDLRAAEVDALTESIKISNKLFKNARAEYMEVLMTQRDALESKFDLVETKMKQMNAVVNMYQALGGGWKN